MNSTSYFKAISIIEEMKKFEEMKVMWQKRQPDPLADFMVLQCQDSKQDLLRQLVAELFQSGLSLKSLDYFFRNAASYLKKFDTQNVPDERLKENLADVEKMLVA